MVLTCVMVLNIQISNSALQWCSDEIRRKTTFCTIFKARGLSRSCEKGNCTLNCSETTRVRGQPDAREGKRQEARVGERKGERGQRQEGKGK